MTLLTLAQLGSRLGLKMSKPPFNGNTKAQGGYPGAQVRVADPPSDTAAPRATYSVPGSTAVQVSGEALPRTISSLKVGEKILGMDVGTGDALIWVTVHEIAMAPAAPQNQIIVELGQDEHVALMAQQVVLAKDRKKKTIQQQVRRLEIGINSLVVFNPDGLRKGNPAHLTKKVGGVKLVKTQESTSLYQITAGSSEQAVLMLASTDANLFYVSCPPNSTVDMKAVVLGAKKEEIASKPEYSKPEVKIQNTFITIVSEAQKEAREELVGGGMQRSYSDSDIRKLAIELELEEARHPPRPLFADDEILDTSSNRSSTLTSKSRQSTISFLRSEVSSMSGGSVTDVRVGTRPVVDGDGKLNSRASDYVQLTEYSKLPVNEYGVRLPLASVEHQPGRRSRCRKCAFFNTFSIKKGKVCKNGALCDFCHETHDRFIHRR